jgi:hypothetical protein
VDFDRWDWQSVYVWVAFLSDLYDEGSFLVVCKSMKDGLSSWQYIVDELSELVVINLIDLDLSTFQLLYQVPVQK